MNAPPTSQHAPLRTVAILATVFVFCTGCLDREPPRLDADERREEISADYQSVHESVEQQGGAVHARLDEARSEVEKTGEVEFPEVQIEELLGGGEQNREE